MGQVNQLKTGLKCLLNRLAIKIEMRRVMVRLEAICREVIQRVFFDYFRLWLGKLFGLLDESRLVFKAGCNEFKKLS